MDKHIIYLEKIIENLDEYAALNGKNKSIRDRESSKISSAVFHLSSYLEKNEDLSELLLEYHGGNYFGYEETLSFKYIVRDTQRFINYLKEKENNNREIR